MTELKHTELDAVVAGCIEPATPEPSPREIIKKLIEDILKSAGLLN